MATSHNANAPSMITDELAFDIFAAQFAAHMTSSDSGYDNGYCTPSSMWSSPPSPTSSEGAGRSTDFTDESSTSASQDAAMIQKSKRANRYKNCTEAVLSRRRAQNRVNQRAYRKRKEQRLQELQDQLDNVNQKNDALNNAYSYLATECTRLKSGQVPEQGKWPANPSRLEMAAVMAAYQANLGPGRTAAGPSMDGPGSPDQWWGSYQ